MLCVYVFKRQESVWVKEDLLCVSSLRPTVEVWWAASQSRQGQGPVWGSKVTATLSPVSQRSSITGRRAKMRSNIHKQAGKVCTYMQTSLCLFIPFLSSGIHDPRPFQNNTDLTCALFWLLPQLLFLISLQVLSYFISLFSCLHSLSHVSSQFSLSRLVLWVVKSSSSSPWSKAVSYSLYLPPTFLTSSPPLFIHPLPLFFLPCIDSHPLIQS